MIRRLIVCALLATSLGAALIAPPAATAAPPAGNGWQPYRQAPVSLAAGTVCAFGVDSAPVRDEEYFRTLTSYPDGSPRLEEYTGPLVVRFTNHATGHSVVRDLSGTAFFYYGSDGSLVVPWHGGGNISVHTGNVGYPAGDWMFTGNYVLLVGSDGNRAVVQANGTRENLCATLA